MRAVLILNPVSKRAELAEAQIRGAAVRAGVERLIVARTTPDRPGGDQARRALECGAELVVVAGGDGTVREVAQVLAGTPAALGIVPVGTANLFARNLGMSPHRVALNAASAFTGSDRRVDVGVARLDFAADDHVSQPSEVPFLTVAGIGHDASTVIATRDSLKRQVGWLAYFESGARHLGRIPIPMSIQEDDEDPRDVQVWSYLVGNAPRIPGKIEVFPGAVLDDGEFDTLAVTVRRVRDWAPVGAKGLLHLRRDVPGLSYGRAREVVVTPAEPAAVQLDGDAYAGVVRLSVTMRPGALTVRT